MLDCKPDNLRMEVEEAIQARKTQTDITEDLIKRYAGADYRTDWEPDGATIDNHEFEFLVNTAPNVMAQNPVVSVKSRRPVVQREVVGAMKHGLNRWIKDTDLQGTLEPVIYDAIFKWGVAVVGMEPLPGYENREVPPLRPAVSRVSPNRFFIDTQAESAAQSRFLGHVFVRDREDMLEAKQADGSPKYDAEAIKSLGGPDGDTDTGSMGFFKDLDINVERDQIVAAEVYVPEKRMIYTIGFSTTDDGKTKKSAYIRKPRKYFGHPRGPYIVFGFYIVPDQVFPLSPLCVTAEAVEELNAHSDQIRRQASTARNLVLVDGENTAMLDAIKNFNDGSIASIPHFNRNAFAELSLGGPHPGQIEYVDRSRDRIDRRSGLTDIQRGQVSGKATATEAQLAASASSGRLRYMQQKIRRSVVQLLENVAWLMFESESIVFPVSKEKAEKLSFAEGQGPESVSLEGTEEADSTFYGGRQEGQEDYTFFDLEIEIDPYSMEQVDEAVLQKRMETAIATITSFAPLMMQFPFVNWPEIMDDYFQSINIPDGRKYINFEMLAQMMRIQFSAGQPMGIPGLDGAPAVDLSTFKGPPNMPGGQAGKQIANQGPQTEQGAATQTGALAGGANSAA